LLADFGIARSLNDISGLTATNFTVGTVAYAAPEQLLGEDLDGRTDQCALAATAYHLLTGSKLFPNTNPAVVIGRHLNASPPALADTHPDLAVLDSVLNAALAKDPGNRFARCADFASAFASAAAQLHRTADQRRKGPPKSQTVREAAAETIGASVSAWPPTEGHAPEDTEARMERAATPEDLREFLANEAVGSASRAESDASPTPSSTTQESVAASMSTPAGPAAPSASRPHATARRVRLVHLLGSISSAARTDRLVTALKLVGILAGLLAVFAVLVGGMPMAVEQIQHWTARSNVTSGEPSAAVPPVVSPPSANAPAPIPSVSAPPGAAGMFPASAMDTVLLTPAVGTVPPGCKHPTTTKRPPQNSRPRHDTAETLSQLGIPKRATSSPNRASCAAGEESQHRRWPRCGVEVTRCWSSLSKPSELARLP
jgi:hypothetical protein